MPVMSLLTISSIVQKSLDFISEAHIVGLHFSATLEGVNRGALIFKLQKFGIGFFLHKLPSY